MNATNLNIVLTNALCCSSQLATKVSKLYSIGNTACADEELAKLKLLNDRIKELKCYHFPVVGGTSSVFEISVGEALYGIWNSILGAPGTVGPETSSLSITLNSVTYIIYGDDVTTCKDLIVNKLTELGVFISYTATPGIESILLFTLTCENITLSISIYEKPIKVYSFTNTVLGECVLITAINCLTEDQMNTMTLEVMKQCDICECQLTQ